MASVVAGRIAREATGRGAARRGSTAAPAGRVVVRRRRAMTTASPAARRSSRGRRALVERQRVHAVGVEHEADRARCRARRTCVAGAGDAALVADRHAPTRRRSRVELVGADVELAVAEAVDPQHLGVDAVGLLARQRRPCPASAGRRRRAGRARRGRRRCRGGRRPGRTRRGRRTSRPARRGGSRGWSARRRARRRRRSPPPARAGRCRGRPARRRRRPPRSATARRAVPTPGSTTASTTPSGTYGIARARASDPPRTSNGRMPWVRSIDRDVRGEVAEHGLDDADELVVEAVVGEERHRVVAPAHRDGRYRVTARPGRDEGRCQPPDGTSPVGAARTCVPARLNGRQT